MIRSRIAAMLAVVLVAGCGVTTSAPTDGPTGRPSVTPTPTDRPSPSETPSPPADRTPVPTPDPTTSPPPAAERHRWGEQLRVTVNGLAVRRAPFGHIDLVDEWRYDPDVLGRVPTGEGVRLDAGDLVYVELGPLVLDGAGWYYVYPITGDNPDEIVGWDANDDGFDGDGGWIAAGTADGPYLEPAGTLPPDINPALVDAAGTGTYTSDRFSARSQLAGHFALATDGQAPCDLTVTLQPTGEVLVSTSLASLLEEAHFSSSSSPLLPAGEYWIDVEARVPGNPEAPCPWALTLRLSQG